jgi:hypothetical protein
MVNIGGIDMHIAKQIFVVLVLLIIFTVIYGNESLTMMTVSVENGDTLTVIYEGVPKKSILDSLKKARVISERQAEKAAVIEGIYHLEIQNGSEIQTFSVQNNYWIYDEINKKILRCELLNHLRDMLFIYLYEKNILPFS